ncbi:MAG: hypothetical protein ACLU5J_06955 [Christensenellales bacterium]
MLNNNIFFQLLENVPADELGKNWELFQIIAIFLGIIPWIILIVYLVFFRRYRIRYFVDNQLVHVCYYKKKAIILDYSYQNLNKWYIDEDCTIVFEDEVMPNKNIKLFTKIIYRKVFLCIGIKIIHRSLLHYCRGYFCFLLFGLLARELIDIIVKMLGIILIIIGGFSLFIYNHTKKVGTFVNMTFLYDGIFKILFGLAILFIPIGLISFILGIVFLIYTVIIAIMEKNLLDLFGKSLYKLMIAFMLIFCGIENIGIWILRVIDIVIILYGFILLIVC